MQISNIGDTATSDVSVSSDETNVENFTNITNIRIDDESCASSIDWPNPFWYGKMHDFAIPSNAIITGIKVIGIANRSSDSTVQMRVSIRSRAGGDYSDYKGASMVEGGTFNCANENLDTLTVGGQYVLWGKTWTPSDFNTGANNNIYFLWDCSGAGDVLVDYVEMTVYYTIPATDLIIENLLAQTTRGANGFIQASVPDEGLANLATFLTYLKKPISVFDDAGTKFLGAFEFQKLHVTFNEVIFEGVEYARKSLKCRANYNAQQLTGVLDGVVETVIYDWDDFFSGGRFDAAYEGLPISFKDTDTLSAYFLANSNSDFYNSIYDPLVPTQIFQDYRYTQFTNEDGSYYSKVNDGGYFWGAEHVVDNWYQELVFKILVKSGTVVNTIAFDYGLLFLPLGDYATDKDPTIDIYDYDAADWETLETFSREKYGSATEYTEGQKLITVTPENYLFDESSTVNGYDVYTLKIRIYAGQSNLEDVIVYNYYSRIKITYDDSQAITLGEGKTLTSILGGKQISMVDDGDFELASEFGVSQHDSYIIGTNMKTAIDAAWQAHALNNTLTLTFDATTKGADFADRTNDSLWDMLAGYNKILDRDIWSDNDDPYDVKCKDSYVSTGLTLTEADILNINIPKSWKYTIDTENLYSDVIVVGQTPDIKGSVSGGISNEFTTIEELVVTDGKVASISTAIDKAEALQYLHTNANRSLTFDINMERIDYSTIGQCKTITINLWSGVIQLTDYLIDSLTFQQEAGGPLFLSLTIIRRDHAP